MIQFSFFDLGEMVRKLLEIIIKPEFLKKNKNWNKIKKKDLSSNDNFLSDRKNNFSFAVTEELNQIRKKGLG